MNLQDERFTDFVVSQACGLITKSGGAPEQLAVGICNRVLVFPSHILSFRLFGALIKHLTPNCP